MAKTVIDQPADEAYMVLEANMASLASGYKLDAAIKATQYLLHSLFSQRLARRTLRPRAVLNKSGIDYNL